MPRFLSQADIGNRALQHVGATLMGTLGFAEQTKQARQVSFSYDKLRRAELQRNIWGFAIRTAILRPIATTTMKLVPALWVSTTTYFVGSIVSDENGTVWISQIPNNLGNQPENSNTWAEYAGPLTVSLYDSTTSYRAGELVYTTPGDGTNRVYLSLLDGNSDIPGTATAWDATVTYFKNQVVTRNSTAYMSLIDFNLNQDPATTFVATWSSGTTYASGAKATGSDGLIYTSNVNGNIGHNPTLDATHTFWTNTGALSPWSTNFVSGTGSLNWRQIGGAEFPSGVTIAPVNLVYPPGAGPLSQITTRNVYMLPAGFLRRAPLAPKGGGSGAWWPAEHAADDFDFRDRFFVSWRSDAIPFSFVADTVDVSTFDDMFCEGLAARIGLEVVEPLTQSASKKQSIIAAYQKFMSEAIAVNSILIGPEEEQLDDLIACRY